MNEACAECSPAIYLELCGKELRKKDTGVHACCGWSGTNLLMMCLMPNSSVLCELRYGSSMRVGSAPHLVGQLLDEDEGADEDVGGGDVGLQRPEVGRIAQLLQQVAHLISI